jgi:colanic acid biosynthesis glycosyl transferase WcaI
MVSDVYSASSICLIPLKRGIIGNSVPSKAGLIMACKRTIVNSVDEDSDYYRMFNDNKIGVSVSNKDPYKVAETILDLYKHKDKCELLAQNGYNFCKKYYSRSFNTKKFVDIFYKMAREN